MCGALFYRLDTKKIGVEVSGELQNVELEEIKWSEKVTNEEVLEHIGEKRKLLNTCIEKPLGLDIFYKEIAFFKMQLKDR
jgi:hypothetical protein